MKVFELFRFDFYARDWLLSQRVTLMSLAQQGLYMRMLAASAMQGPLPADPRRLAQLAGVAWEEFAVLWTDPLRGCWVSDGASLTNARLEAEREKAAQRSAKKSEAGRKGNAERWSRPPAPPISTTTTDHRPPTIDSDRVAIASGSHSDPSLSHPWEDACREVIGEASPDLSLWIASCAAWAAHRRDFKHPALQVAGWRRLLSAWLPGGYTAFRDAIAFCADKPWQSLHADKTKAPSPQGRNSDTLAWLAERRREKEAG